MEAHPYTRHHTTTACQTPPKELKTADLLTRQEAEAWQANIILLQSTMAHQLRRRGWQEVES